MTAVHALIHTIGFAKAFHLAKVEQLLLPITRTVGALWLLSALWFAFLALMFVIGRNWWGFVALPAVVLSQILIIVSWSDAKFGTIPNLIILVVAVVGIGSFFMQHRFEKMVRADLSGNNTLPTRILTESDLAHLPLPVQKYLRYTKAVGQPKVKNFRAEFVGGIRGKADEPYMKLHSVQYNFFQNPSRYFYMTASKMGLPATGLHLYRDKTATFDVKLLNWLPVVSARGEKVNQAETVTLFNDMCFIAPATLIDKRIVWEQIDELSVKAAYKNGDISVSAVLYFNEKGELTNFISPDRFDTDGKKYESYPWKTPVSEYEERNGYLLPNKARLIYEKPGGDFIYGELEYEDVRYNVEGMFW